MDDDPIIFSQFISSIGTILNNKCSNSKEVTLVKKQIQESYNTLATIFYEKSFLNWGMWDKNIYNEYTQLNFNFSTLCEYQDIYSQLLLYYLIRPLKKLHFFDRRLLEVGCGNGIGLRVSSEILQTRYALGVDLTYPLVNHAMSNFYKKNKVEYIQSDAECLPFEDCSFDIITNLESSHLYPRLELFFSEVERVLSVDGFFCYSDVLFPETVQTSRLEAFLNKSKTLKIIQKIDLTRMVQSSIYRRLFHNEEQLWSYITALYDNDREKLAIEFPALVLLMGAPFLPSCWLWFKKSRISTIAKEVYKASPWGKKNYFYYLIQKVNK
jgi:SAM-dependent methyltransferase